MKRCTALFLISFIIFFSTRLYAREYKMVFWYPGEEGSTAEAAPVLETFFDYINKKLMTDRISGKYFNSTSEGLSYIKGSKPDFGIISWAALVQNKDYLPAYGVITSVRPFPHGASSESFTIVGYAQEGKGGGEMAANLTIYSSIPLSADFLRTHMFSDLPAGAKAVTTDAMFATLKKIAGNAGKEEAALLTPMEKYTFGKLNGEWKQKLAVIREGKSVSTAKLVYFGPKPAITDAFYSALKSMSSDPEGKEILEELHLKGF